MSNLTFQSRKNRKINKIKDLVNLKLDYESIDVRDTYGFYLTNKTLKSNTKELPMIGSFVNEFPDFWALETETGLYHKTSNTGICWFKDENKIDTIDGLVNAIIYKDIELLKYYKQRYNGVKFFAPVDFSLHGDFDEETLTHNIKRQCLTYLWLTFELDAIVFPLMTYGNEKSLYWCFEHIMDGSNVVVSLKMVMTGPEKEMFLRALMVLVDTKHPKALIVYTVAKHETTMKMLEYAINNGVRIIEVANTMMNKNRGVSNG